MLRQSALAGALLLAMPNAWAADPAEDIETLVITAPLTAWQAGGSASELDSDAMQDIDFTHPSELMARLPGVWIGRGSGQEHLTALRSPVLTGPGSCGSFLLLEESVPIRPAGFCNVNNLFETTVELADSLQVARGPATVSYGGNALHGAIDLDFDEGNPELSDRMSVHLGPWKYTDASLKWLAGEGASPLSLRLFAATEDGYRQAAGYDLQKLRLSQSWGGAADTWKWSLSGINLQQETAGYIEGTGLYRGSEDERRDNLNPEAFRDARAYRMLLHRNSRQASGEADLRVWLRSSDMEFLLHFLPCTPLERNDHSSLGTSWQRSYRAGDTQWAFGVQGEVADVHLDQYQKEDPRDCGPSVSPERFSAGWHYDYDVRSNHLSLWGRGRKELSGGAAALLWDMRLEQLDYDYRTHLPAGPVDNAGNGCGGSTCRYSRPVSGQDRFFPAGLRLAMQFMPGSWQWHVALASGFRPPQIGELYRLQQGQKTADLKPETLVQLEWGGLWQSDRIQLNWALYLSEKQNFIFRDSSRAIQSSGTTDHSGAELGLKARLSDSHRLELALSLASHKYGFSFSGLNNVSVTAGNDIDTAPRHLASAVWQWRPGRNLHLETEWLYTGSYFTDAGNAYSYPGHELLNLRIGWAVLPDLDLGLRLHNALDRDFADRADHSVFSGDRYFPGLPRAIYLSALWRFSDG